MSGQASRTEAAELIRSLIEKIVLTPDERGDLLVVDLPGDLAGILAITADHPSLLKLDETEILKHKKLLEPVRASGANDFDDRQIDLVSGPDYTEPFSHYSWNSLTEHIQNGKFRTLAVQC